MRAAVAAVAASTGVRLTVIAADGTVLADSEQDPAAMENHRQRPEVAAALEGRVASAVRFSSTLERNLVYVAQPAAAPGGVGGAGERARGGHRPARRPGAAAGGAVRGRSPSGAGLAVALVFSRRLTAPIVLLTDVVGRMAGGDFGSRLHLRGSGEVKALADSVNAMGERLQTQFDALEAGARELDALFAAVQAGIAVLGADGRIVRFNPAFPRLIAIADPSGRSVWEVTHEPGLVEAVQARAASAESRWCWRLPGQGACCWRASSRWSRDRYSCCRT